MTYGFYFNQQNCIGCKTCQIACKDVKNLEVGTLLRRVSDFETGTYPEARSFHFSTGCNHCENPACVKNCPTSAMHKAEDGTVLHDDGLCIGCKSCMMACPYGAPQFVEKIQMVHKCDACANRRAVGKNPACVDACYMRALDFGEIGELRDKYGDELVSDLPFLPPSELTHPPLVIKPKEASLSEDCRETTIA